MITKNDCLSILVKLEDNGVEVNPYIKKLAISKDIPMDVLQFIAKNKGIEVINFYEMLRRNHNLKKSPLYVNILRDPTDVNDTITTLVCLLTQVTLYGNKLADNSSFFKEVRAEEISRVIHNYFETGSISDCVSLLKLIKTDLLVLEYINGRRDLE